MASFAAHPQSTSSLWLPINGSKVAAVTGLFLKPAAIPPSAAEGLEHSVPGASRETGISSLRRTSLIPGYRFHFHGNSIAPRGSEDALAKAARRKGTRARPLRGLKAPESRAQQRCEA